MQEARYKKMTQTNIHIMLSVFGNRNLGPLKSTRICKYHRLFALLYLLHLLCDHFFIFPRWSLYISTNYLRYFKLALQNWHKQFKGAWNKAMNDFWSNFKFSVSYQSIQTKIGRRIKQLIRSHLELLLIQSFIIFFLDLIHVQCPGLSYPT